MKRFVFFSFALVLVSAVPVLAQDPTAGDGFAALVAGTTVTLSAVETGAASSLRRLKDQEYAARRQALEDIISQQLFAREAAARGVTSEALLKAEVDDKTTPPSEDDKKGFFNDNKALLGGKSYEEIASQIGEHLQQQNSADRRVEYLRELKAKYGVRVLLEPARVAVDPADGPAFGPKGAPISLVIFSDFQCPHCAKLVDTLHKLEGLYGPSLRVVFRNYPLAMHKDAALAAQAAACADEQKRFWPVHDLLFANQDKLSMEGLQGLVVQAGVKKKAFDKCLVSGRYADRLARDTADAQRYGVSGTPTVFINGRAIFGSQPLGTYEQAVDDELLSRGLPLPGLRTASPKKEEKKK